MATPATNADMVTTLVAAALTLSAPRVRAIRMNNLTACVVTILTAIFIAPTVSLLTYSILEMMHEGKPFKDTLIYYAYTEWLARNRGDQK